MLVDGPIARVMMGHRVACLRILSHLIGILVELLRRSYSKMMEQLLFLLEQRVVIMWWIRTRAFSHFRNTRM